MEAYKHQCNTIIVNRHHIECHKATGVSLRHFEYQYHVDHNKLTVQSVRLAHVVIIYDNDRFKYLKHPDHPTDNNTYPLNVIANHMDHIFVASGIALKP